MPTDTTTPDLLRSESENDWHSLHAIHLLAALASLLHDLGKACQAFQDRLKPGAAFACEPNQYRHEWISLRLFQAFVGDSSSDETWLRRLMAPTPADDARWLGQLQRDGLDAPAYDDKPLAHLPPLARAVGWLVVTHHRLPVMPSRENGRYRYPGAKVRDGFHASQLEQVLSKIACDWNELPTAIDRSVVKTYWDFPHGLPVTTERWRIRAALVSRKLLELSESPDQRDWIGDPYVMHLSRLALMLADHHYSSLTIAQDRESGEKDYPLFANTDRKTGQYNQPLDEHLLGVEKHAGAVIQALPNFQLQLPRLAHHKGLRKRSEDPNYRWQDRAEDSAASMRERAARQGAFIVNMASTGCGKTLANARIMNALADPVTGMRCVFALGLRALTLQTGHAFRELLHLSNDELAIRVGGAANRELFEFHERQAERTGSASTQQLLPEDSHVLFEGNDEHPLLNRLQNDANARSMLAAPLLVCTVDHLTPATESQRGGRQIAPILRLMSGDLVIDEPDDFDLDDLPALARLVHWAGLLGSRVLLSSATLPPALVNGLFCAYQDGRTWFQRNRGERPCETPTVCCAWFDEFDQSQQDCVDSGTFGNAHLAFAEQRHARLGKALVRRRAELVPLAFSSKESKVIRGEFASAIREAALKQHARHHSIDVHGDKRVSFGLVRMANIDPMFDVAVALYRIGVPEGMRIHLCVYHSQFPLLSRSAIEQQLDQALNRRQSGAVFELPDIRRRLDSCAERDQIFIVLGSPVTEVGRDHDYDWAVVEPSSMRSLIQLAGRVRRHRSGACDGANLMVFASNLRSFERPGEPAFCKPGFEGSNNEPEFRLISHNLTTLLTVDERDAIDSRPRIVPRPADQQKPTERLVDLEHARLARQMLPQAATVAALTARQIRSGVAVPLASINAASHWRLPCVTLTAVLPQQQPFRYDAVPRVELALLPDDDGENYELNRIDPGKRHWESIYAPIDESKLHRVPDALVRGERIQAWGQTDYIEALTSLAEALDIPLRSCAERYGTVSLPDSDNGWRFHPALGFTKVK